MLYKSLWKKTYAPRSRGVEKDMNHGYKKTYKEEGHKKTYNNN